ncbi:MAG: 50S ribosomal protein L2 [Candidatus Micrarchaeota archaeon]
MGTRLRQQKRGKGSPAFKSPGHRFFGNITYEMPKATVTGVVKGFIRDPIRKVLIAKIVLQDGTHFYNLAAEGLAVGAVVEIGADAKPTLGSVTKLSNIPDGSAVFNVEMRPGDGGKTSRAGGSSCSKISEDEDTGLVSVQFPSKAVRVLSPNCFATVGLASGGGRLEKPFLKAGNKWFKMKALNRYYPHVRGRAMSAYDHPYGGKTGGKPTMVSHGTPPGRKAGHIGARRTGRRKGKSTV